MITARHPPALLAVRPPSIIPTICELFQAMGSSERRCGVGGSQTEQDLPKPQKYKLEKPEELP